MISVIIPTFNRERFLKKAIGSVLSQTYQDVELVIVDDGSTDRTKEIALSYCVERTASCENARRVTHNAVRYIYQSNKGPAAARNTGIKNSTKPFIAFLDSDDWWDADKLAVQLDAMLDEPDYTVSHTDETWYRGERLLNQKKKHKKQHGYIFDKCLSLCAVSMSTVMIKRGLFYDIGFFDESLPCCEDYDFWLRASARNKFLFIEKALTLKDGGRPDQVSYIYRTGIDRFRIHAIVNLLESGILNPKQKKLAILELRKKCRIYGNGCIKHGRKEEGAHYLGLEKN
ncbi:MAG: glycosyltransferase family 2 protein [Candidatus Omnitrophica bacterium]|nr:glycosyltransferase family 2 protein [Candidatus Omnitrophota bacterium]MBU1933322.1 glycosyltransferase family 2 protein [Candidatus Omnitrophota bacterium]